MPNLRGSDASKQLRHGAANEMLDKYEARKRKRQIADVLWTVWDPIGVRELGGPHDEYDGYVNGVYELLASGASDQNIAEHLHHIVSDRMGLTGASVSDMWPTVAALRQLRIGADVERCS